MSGRVPEFPPPYDFLFHCCTAAGRQDYRGALETFKKGLRRNVESPDGADGVELTRNVLAAVRFVEAGLRAAHGPEPERRVGADGSSEAHEERRCSFCGKRGGEVGKVISGPGVQICDRCVAVCNEILSEDAPAPPNAG